MLWNAKLAYIYMPRTASKTLNVHFSRTWAPPIFGTASPGQLKEMERVAKKPAFITAGRGHRNLQHATDVLYRHGRTLESLDKIVFVIRNPYTLAFSNYNFLRAIAKSNPGNKNAHLAATSNFQEFCKQFPHPNPSNWVKIDGRYPRNLHIIHFEYLDQGVRDLEESAGIAHEYELQHFNKTDFGGDLRDHITEEAEAIIFDKYVELFQLGQYERWA